MSYDKNADYWQEDDENNIEDIKDKIKEEIDKIDKEESEEVQISEGPFILSNDPFDNLFRAMNGIKDPSRPTEFASKHRVKEVESIMKVLKGEKV